MSLANNCLDNHISCSLLPLAPGENGTMEYTRAGVGDSRVALFFSLVRNIPSKSLFALFSDCIGQVRTFIRAGKQEEAAILAADLFVLAFQTRDCRGGKGERKLFYMLIYHLYTAYPETIRKLISLIPTYGYHKDFLRLVSFLESIPTENRDMTTPIQRLQEEVMTEMALQLQDDATKLASSIAAGKPPSAAGLSLIAKYAPREGKAFEKRNKVLFAYFLHQLFPTASSMNAALVTYRRMLATLTPFIDTVETKMCGKRFAEIDFDHVPSIASKKYRKAFLNDDLEKPSEEKYFNTGNRYAEDADRIACRTHLVERIQKGQVNGKQLFPHEIVREFMNANQMQSTYFSNRKIVSRVSGKIEGKHLANSTVMSSVEEMMLCVQWKNLREHIVSGLQMKKEAGELPAIDIGRLVPLVDVSSSMAGEPMEVAIALGILVSEINQEAFRHRVLTFETKPNWVQLNESMSLREKVRVTQRAPWGASTNFQAAMLLIAEVIETNRLPMEEVPDMIIFSDMQFDKAGGCRREGAQTQLQLIGQMFHDLGMRVAGVPYPAPRIIFWNLRGDTAGFPATSASQNVQMLSGYSPSLFKFVLEGEAAAEDPVPQGNSSMAVDEAHGASSLPPPPPPVKATIDPYTSLRKILDSERYFAIREILSASTEKELAHYHFERPPQVPSVSIGKEMASSDCKA